MRTLLWAVAVLALEVLLLWGYFAVAGMGRMASTIVALALLVGNVSVMVWLGFVSGFGQALKRLLVAVLGCIILTYAALVVADFVDLPTALVCERGRTELVDDPDPVDPYRLTERWELFDHVSFAKLDNGYYQASHHNKRRLHLVLRFLVQGSVVMVVMTLGGGGVESWQRFALLTQRLPQSTSRPYVRGWLSCA